MPVLSYSGYAADLRQRILQLRGTKNANAFIEIMICRNGFCYKSSENIGAASTRVYSLGPQHSPTGFTTEDGSVTEKAVEAFFALPKIYAYSDNALAEGRSPLSKAHWDGTLAFIEIRYETLRVTWHQRMLLIGFEDPIHADFTIGLEAELLMNEGSKGKQLFEWRANDVDDIEPANGARPHIAGSNDETSLADRLTAFARQQWSHAR